MHAFHEGLAGYHPEQILHDGCPECEDRAAMGVDALGHLDDFARIRAWRLMRAEKWSGGESVGYPVSVLDWTLANTLYAVAVFMERCGIKPDEIEARLCAKSLEVYERGAQTFMDGSELERMRALIAERS